MKIQMNEFTADPADLVQAELGAIERVVRSGWYILGPEVRAFEAQWAGRCGTAEAVGVANGLDAIEIGLRALGIGPGDEVITTPMTAFATVLAVLRSGAIPVMADIDINTGLLNGESVIRCIGPRSRALLLVHLYGQVGDMDYWQTLTQACGIELVEDCAQAHGASWKGKSAGSFGRLGAYSFYPTKNLGTLGDGGAIVTSDDGVASRARVIRNYGQTQRYVHDLLGANSRLDEIHAALLCVRLKWLNIFTARRRAIANRYFREIANPLVVPLAMPASPESHVHHLFVVTAGRRDDLSVWLKTKNIETLCHYPVPIHRQHPCKDILRDPAGLENAERLADTCLSIPCHPNLSDDSVGAVIEAVNGFR
jgi:dTDP-4-amino-4,6-dideoxygalactose transaminase